MKDVILVSRNFCKGLVYIDVNDDNGYGIYVVGIIVVCCNGIGVCGVVLRCSFVIVKVFDYNGSGDVGDIIVVMKWFIVW